MVWLLCKKKISSLISASKCEFHVKRTRTWNHFLKVFGNIVLDRTSWPETLKDKNAWSTTEASLFTGRTSWLFFSPGKMEVITDWEWGCSYHFIVHFISWCFLFYWQLYIIFNGMICIHVHSWWLGDKKASPKLHLMDTQMAGIHFRTVGFCLWHINAWSQIQRIQN